MEIKGNERIDDIQIGNLKIIQRSEWFSYGIDAVLLAEFCDTKKGERIIDLGTGTGIIPLLLSEFTSFEKIIGVEIQDEVAEMAKRSILMNSLNERIKIEKMDLKDAPKNLGKGICEVVVSNPPYMSYKEGIKNEHGVKAISRHEIKTTLENVIETASALLKDNGKFYLIHRPHRLVDIFMYCRKYRLEPKLIRFVHPNSEKAPNIVLIKCTKFGNTELKYLNPLFVYNKDGRYTDEIMSIYRRKNK